MCRAMLPTITMVGVITGVNVVDSVPDHEIESVACTIDEQGSNVLSLDTIFHTRVSAHHGGCSILTHTVLSDIIKKSNF